MTQAQLDAGIAKVLNQLEHAATRQAEQEIRRRWREEKRLVFVNCKPYFRAYHPKQKRGAAL